ncbi:MAG: YbaK/EbsC family protein [Nanoarchaeota archaeon]|nr:YbaK/EbsC family protein [Nanoarchaeota archaeon]
MEHRPVYTCEEAAKVRGTKIEQAAKALVFKADTKPVLAVLQGSKEIDEEKLKHILNAKILKMARADEVKQIMECDIGSVHPFGNLAGLKVIVDENLLKEEDIVFNAGSHTISIKMKSSDYKKVVEPRIGSFAK